jgi:ubiquinone/menaquinone biosynthesis C-methylase UbiE
VLSSLGLQFVPDKVSALREMRRVLAPDGQFAIARSDRHRRSSQSSNRHSRAT